ncbi:MAG: hypothetical protein UX66_C0019G0001, partial [Parcubacteria group bacterium GW2011_GWF2_46_8]
AIVLRYQSLTMISGMATAFLGITSALNIGGADKRLYTIALLILFATTTLSLARYIDLTRTDIEKLANKIDELPSLNLNKPIKPPKQDNDYCVEILYISFFIGITLFLLSF